MNNEKRVFVTNYYALLATRYLILHNRVRVAIESILAFRMLKSQT